MQRGTHQEAREAGFTDEQAAFFSRMMCDTKNECWQKVAEDLKKRDSERLLKFMAGIKAGASVVAVFLLGFLSSQAINYLG